MRYRKRIFHRAHYEDMWNLYERCEIDKHECKDSSRWSRENPIKLFKKKSKESLVELKLWSNKEFKGR